MRVVTAVLIFLSCGVLALASTNDELVITTPGYSATITDVGGTANCSGNACTGLTYVVTSSDILVVDGTVGQWTETASTGTSNSPNIQPFGIKLNTSATCSTNCSTDSLSVEYTDIGFSSPVTGFTATYSGSGSTLSAYYDSSNAVPATTLIGTLPSGGANSVSVAASPGTDYSLTLAQVFTGTGNDSGYGVITAVPEPLSIVLFGTVLCLGACVFRRRSISRKA